MIVGIDLGTTNSAIGVWRDGKAELIPNRLGHVLTPSAVSVDEAGKLLVGLAARERQSTHPAQTATIFKRYMGSRRATQLGKQSYLPEELSALVLQSLKLDAEAYLGQAVTEAVITVPAYFSDKQRKATRRAGELAGLKVERLLNEPTAAALAYGLHRLEEETKFLVFDLGGGTFDVSILEIFEGVIEVRASTGDNRLGGEDFNEILMDLLRQEMGTTWPAGEAEREALRPKLRAAAERARRQLTDSQTATMQLVWKGEAYKHEITADAFETHCAALLDKLKEPVIRALRDSDIRPELLREIVLVGGATRMPLVRRVVTKMFGRFPALTVNPDEAVALGAAIQSGLKARNADLKEVTVTDVCPYTLGVEIAERGPQGSLRKGLFSPVIERNIVVPASRSRVYSTVMDGQPQVKLNIYQGESRFVADNIHLGAIAVPVPPKPAGHVQIDCRFSYDINGLLEIDVHVPETGSRQQLVIVDEDGPSGDDLQRQRAALAKLKLHPRETETNRAALARANRCFEEVLGAKRDFVAQLTGQFEAVLDGQDPRAIEVARAALLEALDRLEGQTFF